VQAEQFIETTAQLAVVMMVGAADPTLAVVGTLIYGFGWLADGWYWSAARFGTVMFFLLVAVLAKGIVQERVSLITRRLRK
jgi:hypothetical protein